MSLSKSFRYPGGSVEERIKCIVRTIKTEEARLRAKYPLLQYQDAIGLGILCLSLVGMVGAGALYFYAVIPAWVCIVVAALFASVSHELEHDLIHRQYFRHNPFMHNLMMLLVWIMRPNTINPWYRRDMHFLHHKVSGTEKDLEERLVGNGITYGLLRYLVMFDGLLGMIVRRAVLRRDVDGFSVRNILLAAFPLSILYFGLWYVFLGFHAFDAIWGVQFVYPEWFNLCMNVVSFFIVTLVAPNFIRSGCLNFITSAMHYYGNVENLIQQTQVLKPWFLFPMHMFCFNFGSTHGIHHFVVGQPFYLRQMVVKVAHKVMKENGVRFNDLSTFLVANRFLPN